MHRAGLTAAQVTCPELSKLLSWLMKIRQ